MLDLFRRKKVNANDDLFDLDNPDKVFKPDGYDDCLSCRVFGSTALVALGGYTYFAGMKNLRERRRLIEMSNSRYKYGSRQLGILGLSASLLALGVYRTIN